MGALIAPQPLKIISARRDPSFPAAGYHDVYRRIRAIYDYMERGTKCRNTVTRLPMPTSCLFEKRPTNGLIAG